MPTVCFLLFFRTALFCVLYYPSLFVQRAQKHITALTYSGQDRETTTVRNTKIK